MVCVTKPGASEWENRNKWITENNSEKAENRSKVIMNTILTELTEAESALFFPSERHLQRASGCIDLSINIRYSTISTSTHC